MHRRQFLLVAAGAALFPWRGLIPSAKAAELQPFCPHVDGATLKLLKEKHYASIGCCNQCLTLMVGERYVNLFDQGFLDFELEGGVRASVSMPRFSFEEPKTLEELRGKQLEKFGLGLTKKDYDPEMKVCTLNGDALLYIFKIIENNRGQRFLSYASHVPDSWHWYSDPITPEVVGWVLGAAEINQGDWNRNRKENGFWNPAASFAECIGKGQLPLKANAFIALR